MTPLIIALKEIGFKYVWVDVYELDEDFRLRSIKMSYREIYRLTGLKPSMSLPRGFRVASSSRAIFKKLVGMEKSKEFKKNIDKLLEEAAGSSKAESTRPSGKVLIPSWADDIKVRGSRSAKDVLETMHQRKPGLRHVYNKFLKKKPGFEGRVVLRLEIAPSGEVVRTAVAYSSTGYKEFDNAVRDYVGQMTFGEVESGNAKVTIPLTFYQR